MELKEHFYQAPAMMIFSFESTVLCSSNESFMYLDEEYTTSDFTLL